MSPLNTTLSPSLRRSSMKQKASPKGYLIINIISPDEQKIYWQEHGSNVPVEIIEGEEDFLQEAKFCTQILCVNSDKTLCNGYIKSRSNMVPPEFFHKMEQLEKSILSSLEKAKNTSNINIQDSSTDQSISKIVYYFIDERDFYMLAQALKDPKDS